MDLFSTITPWLDEFLLLAVAHLLAVISPGPDYAVVTRNSVRFGRRAGVMTSIGVGAGILVHVAYSLVGVGLLLQKYPALFNGLTLIASGYLLFLAWQSVRSQGHAVEIPHGDEQHETVADFTVWKQGFLTNVLNPKATLFFLTIFTSIVSADTPVVMHVLYASYISLSTGIWFCYLSYLVSQPKIRVLLQNSRWFDRAMALVLLILAARMLSGLSW